MIGRSIFLRLLQRDRLFSTIRANAIQTRWRVGRSLHLREENRCRATRIIIIIINIADALTSASRRRSFVFVARSWLPRVERIYKRATSMTTVTTSEFHARARERETRGSCNNKIHVYAEETMPLVRRNVPLAEKNRRQFGDEKQCLGYHDREHSSEYIQPNKRSACDN